MNRDRFDPARAWDWKAALQNGSRRTPETWTPMPGDEIAGVVVDTGQLPPRYRGQRPVDYLDLRVIGGSMNGEPLEVDSWWRLLCNRSRLIEMMQKDVPEVGDRVAVAYLGMRHFKSGLSRASYRTVVEKVAPAAAGGGDEW